MVPFFSTAILRRLNYTLLSRPIRMLISVMRTNVMPLQHPTLVHLMLPWIYIIWGEEVKARPDAVEWWPYKARE